MEVWPDNWATYLLFCDIDNQWRMGSHGPVALDYSVLFQVMQRLGLEGEDWNRTFDEIRAMEGAALKALRTK